MYCKYIFLGNAKGNEEKFDSVSERPQQQQQARDPDGIGNIGAAAAAAAAAAALTKSAQQQQQQQQQSNLGLVRRDSATSQNMSNVC